MNILFWGEITVVVLSFFLPPLLILGVGAYFRPISAGGERNEALGRVKLQECYEIWRNASDFCLAPRRIFALMYLLFQFLSLLMLVTEKNLLSVLFAENFALTLLVLGGFSNRHDKKRYKLRECLFQQAILFAVIVGIFLATGSLAIADALNVSKLLGFDMPFLFLALLGLCWGWPNHGVDTIEHSVSSEVGVRMQMVLDWGFSYQIATILLLACILWTHTLLSTVTLAILLYLGMNLLKRFSSRLESILPGAVSVKLCMLACGLNLTWLYLKYWWM